jgi:carotenoid 1,2-hydratase
MTERGRGRLARDASALAIGPSALHWDGSSLRIDIAEVTAPLPSKLRGTIRLHPGALIPDAYLLDTAQRHVWSPIATRARVEVDLTQPGLSWRGEGYFDSNFGTEPLEDGFSRWGWSRAHLREDSVVLYEGTPRRGDPFALGLRFDGQGRATEVEMPPEVDLPKTGWRMPRVTRADAGWPVVIRKTWEDTPFYARTALSARLFGEAADVVHESLSLDRLRKPIVKAMLPFRMPRIAR